MTGPTVLRAARWADVDAGQVGSPAEVVVDGARISAVNPEGPLPDSVTSSISGMSPYCRA